LGIRYWFERYSWESDIGLKDTVGKQIWLILKGKVNLKLKTKQLGIRYWFKRYSWESDIVFKDTVGNQILV